MLLTKFATVLKVIVKSQTTSLGIKNLRRWLTRFSTFDTNLHVTDASRLRDILSNVMMQYK